MRNHPVCARYLRKWTVKSKQSLVLRMLTAITFLLAQVFTDTSTQGSYGPCEVTHASGYQNTIGCNNGCIGEVKIVPQQKSCQGLDENECTSWEIPLLVTYQPKAIIDEDDFRQCMSAVGTACVTCMIAAGLVCMANPLACIVAGSVCSGACAGVGVIATSPCCWTTCEQDLTTRFEVPGGSSC